MAVIKPIEWQNGKIRLLDQTRLPGEVVYLELRDYDGVVQAIREMKVRGAPLLGVVAAYGIVLGVKPLVTTSRQMFLTELKYISSSIGATRPTAVNLFRALSRMTAAAQRGLEVDDMKRELLREAQLIEAEEAEANQIMGAFGAELIADGATVLTHCNAGALATVGYGTALGVIRAAHGQGKKIQVLVTETRPLLQGARLTAWELSQDGIPFTLITDSMAGYFMQQGKVSCVLVGADRIAANGDVANKIGTYTLAVLATENGLPFYVVAPTSTIDLGLATGAQIPIEERDPAEVTHLRGIPIAPAGTRAANPAFDVTPHIYITAIITEKGVLREPYEDRIRKLLKEA